MVKYTNLKCTAVWIFTDIETHLSPNEDRQGYFQYPRGLFHDPLSAGSPVLHMYSDRIIHQSLVSPAFTHHCICEIHPSSTEQ